MFCNWTDEVLDRIEENLPLLDESVVDFLWEVEKSDSSLEVTNQLFHFFAEQLFDGNIEKMVNQFNSDTLMPFFDYDSYKHFWNNIGNKNREQTYGWFCTWLLITGTNPGMKDHDELYKKFMEVVRDRVSVFFDTNLLKYTDFSYISYATPSQLTSGIDLLQLYDNLGVTDKYYAAVTTRSYDIKLPEEAEYNKEDTAGISLYKEFSGNINFDFIGIPGKEVIKYIWVPLSELKKFNKQIDNAINILHKNVILSHGYPYVDEFNI